MRRKPSVAPFLNLIIYLRKVMIWINPEADGPANEKVQDAINLAANWIMEWGDSEDDWNAKKLSLRIWRMFSEKGVLERSADA
jgi:hypothetical protein